MPWPMQAFTVAGWWLGRKFLGPSQIEVRVSLPEIRWFSVQLLSSCFIYYSRFEVFKLVRSGKMFI